MSINSDTNKSSDIAIGQPYANTAIAAASKAMVDNTFNAGRHLWLYLKIRHNAKNLVYDELAYINKKFYDNDSNDYKSAVEINNPFEDIGAIGRSLVNKGVIAIVGARSLQTGEVPAIAGVVTFPVFYASLNPLTRKNLVKKGSHGTK